MISYILAISIAGWNGIPDTSQLGPFSTQEQCISAGNDFAKTYRAEAKAIWGFSPNRIIVLKCYQASK